MTIAYVFIAAYTAIYSFYLGMELADCQTDWNRVWRIR